MYTAIVTQHATSTSTSRAEDNWIVCGPPSVFTSSCPCGTLGYLSRALEFQSEARTLKDFGTQCEMELLLLLLLPLLLPLLLLPLLLPLILPLLRFLRD